MFIWVDEVNPKQERLSPYRLNLVIPFTDPRASTPLGKLLSDSMCDWVWKKLVLGLYDPDNLLFINPRVSPMSIAPKPNGAGRIVVDMSAPQLPADRVNIYGTSPIALNAGTDPKKFPSTGVSTLHVLKQFHALGPNCFFSKQDWSDAYKHIIVRTGDLRLKCVGFLGKIFCKGSLTFGASSSLSIFDCQKYRGY